MSLKIEAIVDELSKIPAYGKELEGIRVRGAVVDGPGYVSFPIDLELGLVPPKIGDTLRVEATWGPIGEPFQSREDDSRSKVGGSSETDESVRTSPEENIVKNTQRTTKLELVEILADLPDYMVAAGEIIGILKNRITEPDSLLERSSDDQKRRALELVRFHFRLAE